MLHKSGIILLLINIRDHTNTDNTIEDIQHCITQLGINEPLLATEYICIDEQLPIERFTDDEIIATVQNVEDEDEEDKEKSDNKYVPQSMISLKTALTSVDNLMRFVNDPPSGFVFHYQFCVH